MYSLKKKEKYKSIKEFKKKNNHKKTKNPKQTNEKTNKNLWGGAGICVCKS